ncbi:MAG: polymer-forming cytoskeletal protein [Aquificaceae bacterium]
MFKRETKPSASQEIKNLIAAGCLFEGNLTITDGLTRMDGEIKGNIMGNGGLIVGEQGIIRGNINVKSVVVYGTVEGDISAESVEIKAKGRMKGNITTSELMVERGAIFNGECKMEVYERKGAEPSENF